MAKARGDSSTRDLIGWSDGSMPIGFAQGQIRGTRMASRISQAVSLALKACSMSRAEIATAMSAELGYSITESTLDAYASEAKEVHKITLERFMALILVTGATELLLGFVAEPFGFVAVPDKYQALIELHQIEEHERAILEHQAALALRKAELQARFSGGQP
jgi:hypothetical protein